MLTQLLDHNEDLKKLKEEGYNISIINGNLLIQQIPYVNENKEIKIGMIFCSLNMSGEILKPPTDHTVHFVGEFPCNQKGIKENSYVNSPRTYKLTDEIIASYYFSAKPQGRMYYSYYEKMKKYIDLLSAPAKSIDPGVSAKTFNTYKYSEESIFNYTDTHSSRAGINSISEKLESQKIAIVGLGGTGSYLLDFISKTPVKQISIFDGDDMLNHNAFRIPGTISIEELRESPSKVSFLKKKYEKLRKEVIAHETYLNSSNLNLLDGHDFVFLSIDNAEAKKDIIGYLLKSKIPFIDLGMGLTIANDAIRGSIRKTLITPDNQSHLDKIEMNKQTEDDLYSTNIQISELNALNAILGVITWKKLNNFYLTDQINYNSTFIIDEKVIHNAP